MATTTKAERLQSPGWSLPRLTLAGQALGSIRNPLWQWQIWGRLSERRLHAPRESILLYRLLPSNPAVEICTCCKKIKQLDEGSKDEQGQCCKPAARSFWGREPFSWRVHIYHCCICWHQLLLEDLQKSAWTQGAGMPYRHPSISPV